MTALRALLTLVLGLSMMSCSTTPRHSGNPPVLDRLAEMGIDSRTYAKIANHRILTFGDILGLLQKKVPSPVILTYIQSTHAPYTLTNNQLTQLMDAGASAELINYLGKSVGFFEATERDQTGGAGKWKNDPFFVDPYFLGPAPFDYGYPDMWWDDEWVGAVF